MLARLALLATFACAAGFYLPGVSPWNYEYGEDVVLKVNKLDSVRTQLPYEYYSLPFCRPEKIVESAENLGEVLSGDMIENSMYKISMKIIESCKTLCQKSYKKHELQEFESKIRDEYHVNWIIDNLPAAFKYYTEEVGENGEEQYESHYAKGFALGFVATEEDAERAGTEPGVAYINNHARLVLFYHQDPASFVGYRIVAFEVEAFSVKHEMEAGQALKTCTPLNPVRRAQAPQPVSGLEETDIIWTYDVQWQSSNIKWASRWDVYFKMTDSKVHWFSIINSIAVVLFLSAMVAMIVTRTLHRDLLRYNSPEEREEAQEETGWKLIHGDVFRPPAFCQALCVIVGTGYQLIGMSIVTLFFAVLGFLSPANRGGLMTSMLLLFVLMGIFAGFAATYLAKIFGMEDWRGISFATSICFPGIAFVVFFILNAMVWGEKSSGAVPFGTLVALLVLWFGMNVPLVYIGAYISSKRPAPELPMKVKKHPREIPEQVWYAQAPFLSLLGGILPFAACFIEIFFIMSSVWMHQFYYMFGFLFIVFIILTITCAEISIVATYFQLCYEDYHWWWRSFCTSGFSAIYLFLYSIMYYYTKMRIDHFVSSALYFGYMFLICIGFFVLTGTIGFSATYFFVHKIYSSVKID
ncbi:hypothetical protein AAMO2058_000068800 [Amorphochlora amoebiformis]|eukprot:1321638-Amorphochlora_amoeboformis.AAC.1